MIRIINGFITNTEGVEPSTLDVNVSDEILVSESFVLLPLYFTISDTISVIEKRAYGFVNQAQSILDTLAINEEIRHPLQVEGVTDSLTIVESINQDILGASDILELTEGIVSLIYAVRRLYIIDSLNLEETQSVNYS